MVELQQKVTLAFEHSFSLGQLVCDSNHNLFMVIKILSDPELGTTTLKLIAQDGKEISGSATDYSLSEDVTSIPSFIDQVAHHWKVYGSSKIRQAWIGRAETSYRNAKEAWSSLNTAARKFSGSAR